MEPKARPITREQWADIFQWGVPLGIYGGMCGYLIASTRSPNMALHVAVLGTCAVLGLLLMILKVRHWALLREELRHVKMIHYMKTGEKL